MRLLVIEDDPMLGETLRNALKDEGYVVDWITNGKTALTALKDDVFDLMILDLGLPGMDGIQVVQHLRTTGSNMPVLILTARDGIQNKIDGLDAGGDDYLLKPFDLKELYARIRALLRRPQTRVNESRLTHGALEIDSSSYQCWHNTQAIPLTRREFALLELFMTRPGQVFTRQQLEQSLYSWDDEVGSNALEVHIHHLRKKLGSDLIVTIRRIGYQLRSGEIT
jgi:two-component system response regulator QseB